MQERDGRHVLQCAWTRVRYVLSDYDFKSWTPSEPVNIQSCFIITFCASVLLSSYFISLVCQF